MKNSPFIAVAGCGHWGKNLVRNFSELEALHSIFDNNPKTADSISKQYNIPSLSWQEILSNQDIKGVVIASPAPFHFDLAYKALKAGKDIYVEKPITLRNDHAQTLCDTAASENKILMVGHLLHYHPAFISLKDMVQSGKLGNLKYIYSNRLSLGKIRREENVLWSFAPHDISMILSLANEQPSFVDAHGSCQTHKTIEDFANVSLSFPSGLAAHITVSWLNPVKEQKLVVIGDQGSIVFDDQKEWKEKLIFYPHKIQQDDHTENVPDLIKGDPVSVSLNEGEPLKLECQHFIDCIQTRSTPRTDGAEGLRVLNVLNLADQKIRSKK